MPLDGVIFRASSVVYAIALYRREDAQLIFRCHELRAPFLLFRAARCETRRAHATFCLFT